MRAFVAMLRGAAYVLVISAIFLTAFIDSTPVFAQTVDECISIQHKLNQLNRSERFDDVLINARQLYNKCKYVGDYDFERFALNVLADTYLRLAKFDQAISAAEMCLGRFPHYIWCEAARGRAYHDSGRYVEARDSYRAVLATAALADDDVNLQNQIRRELDSLDKTLALPRKVPEPAPSLPAQVSYGTGFYVSALGHIVTNAHVIEGCSPISTSEGRVLTLVKRDKVRDLALLKDALPPASVAVLNEVHPRSGEQIVVIGFPLPGILASNGNVTTGIVSADVGFGNDKKRFQISAPVQPGNSGGPVLDLYGHVVGVVVSKLNARKVAEATGDIPQNVNFAITDSELRAFLEDAKVPFATRGRISAQSVADIAAEATRYVVQVVCGHR
jgi:S1-C subfamily serine protease